MERTLPLLKGRITLDEALEEDIDVLQELSYPEKRYQFSVQLFSVLPQIEEIVSRHLNLNQSDFSLAESNDWIHGSYNACIPITIAEGARGVNLPARAIIRFPLPYKVGEDFNPGNSDEKLRCEAATYCWLQQNAPEIPIPRLYGFGFPGKQSFTAVENETFITRFFWSIRRFLSVFNGRAVPRYIPHERENLHDLGYLVLEHVDNGKLLSETWEDHRHDSKRRDRLFGDLSRIMLRLAKLPLPKIGSWTMDDNGVLTLTNRPLTPILQQQENAEIPTPMPRDRTYTSVEPYLLDLLACQDNRIRHQPNSIHYEADGEKQLAALTAMRALLPKYTDVEYREGPFVYSLTDLDQRNIFVDDDWNVTGLINLEWACARPIEMLGPPDWLSGRSLEEITFHLDEFKNLHDEFVDTVEREEMALYYNSANSEIMRECWKSGKFWYTHALDSPSTMLALYVNHIQPRFTTLSSNVWDEFSHLLGRLWDVDTPDFISSKITEQDQYADEVRKLFTQVPDAAENRHEGFM